MKTNNFIFSVVVIFTVKNILSSIISATKKNVFDNFVSFSSKGKQEQNKIISNLMNCKINSFEKNKFLKSRLINKKLSKDF